MKVSQEMQHLMKNNDVNPLSSMSLVFIQVRNQLLYYSYYKYKYLY